MSESGLLKRVRVSLSNIGARLFRNNVGTAWMGDAQVLANGDVLIRKPRRVVFGLHKGSSDLIGWYTITVTPAMAGVRLAVFVACETKSLRGRAQVEQRNFLERVQESGGIAVLARSVEEANTKLEGGICQLISVQSLPPRSRT